MKVACRRQQSRRGAQRRHGSQAGRVYAAHLRPPLCTTAQRVKLTSVGPRGRESPLNCHPAASASPSRSYDPDDYELRNEPADQAQASDSHRPWTLLSLCQQVWCSFVEVLAALLNAILVLPVVYILRIFGQMTGAMVPERTKQHWSNTVKELPEVITIKKVKATDLLVNYCVMLYKGFWPKLHWVWEQPLVKSFHITFAVANWGVRIPAILALIVTQGSIIASQVSLPMLAPLLLGSGILFRSIHANASFIIPRASMMVVLLWCIWFFNSVVQNTWIILSNQGRIDARITAALITTTECVALVLAGIVVLSMLGVKVSGLLLPAGVCAAVAGKDLVQNMLTGFFLFIVQPFRIGDRVAVFMTLPTPSAAPPLGMGGAGASSWLEGVCEKVDLRYTTLRIGKKRLMVPNNAFITREFLVEEDTKARLEQGKREQRMDRSFDQSIPDVHRSSSGVTHAEAEFLHNFWRHRNPLSPHSLRFGMDFEAALADAYAAGKLARSVDGGYLQDGHPASELRSPSRPGSGGLPQAPMPGALGHAGAWHTRLDPWRGHTGYGAPPSAPAPAPASAPAPAPASEFASTPAPAAPITADRQAGGGDGRLESAEGRYFKQRMLQHDPGQSLESDGANASAERNNSVASNGHGRGPGGDAADGHHVHRTDHPTDADWRATRHP